MRIREPKTTALIFASGKMVWFFAASATSVIEVHFVLLVRIVLIKVYMQLYVCDELMIVPSCMVLLLNPIFLSPTF